MKARFCCKVFALATVLLAVSLPGRLVAQEAANSFEQTLKVTGPVTLDLKTFSEDVWVRRGGDGVVRIRCEVKPQNNDEGLDEVQQTLDSLKSTPPFRQEGNRIVLDTQNGGERFPHLNIRYEFEVPAETALKFSTDSGDVRSEGIRGPIEVETASGDGRFEEVENPVKVHTDSGDVLIEQTGDADVEVKTSSGDVHVSLPATKGFDVTLHTESGDISAGQEARDDVHDVQYKIRGGGKTVDVRTESGDIRIE